ncbi:hypothetical protein [Sphingomonas cynarae]|uniref:hypothetical protein n=1 Tax=Sphingomonas cynarae TaxID=930197 RepID=UPI0031D0ED0B
MVTGVPVGTTVTSDVIAGSPPDPPQALNEKAADSIAAAVTIFRPEQPPDRVSLANSCRDNGHTPEHLFIGRYKKVIIIQLIGGLYPRKED